jgi:hypothetical protein
MKRVNQRSKERLYRREKYPMPKVPSLRADGCSAGMKFAVHGLINLATSKFSASAVSQSFAGEAKRETESSGEQARKCYISPMSTCVEYPSVTDSAIVKSRRNPFWTHNVVDSFHFLKTHSGKLSPDVNACYPASFPLIHPCLARGSLLDARVIDHLSGRTHS